MSSALTVEKIWLKSYDSNIPPNIDVTEYQSLTEILQQSFTQFAPLPAYHNMGRTLTYAQLQALSQNFASFLQNDLGLQKGERVALMMPNILQYPVALFGLLQAGLVAVNVNPLYTARELEHQLQDAGAKAIVIFANSAHILEKVLKKTQIRHVIVTEVGDLLGFPKSMLVNFVLKRIKKMVPAYNLPMAISFKSALARGERFRFTPVELHQSDIAFLQYTGGTTGVSKGAILSHGNIVANVLQARTWIKNKVKEGQEIIITPLPLYHIFSLTANCLTFSSMGALNVLITNPRDIAGFVKELKKWKFTAFTGLNTLFNALLNNPDFAKLDFSHLRLTLGGGMAVQKTVAERWKEVTNTPLIEAYGLTETSPAACMNPMSLANFNGFVGLPISSTEVVICNEEGQPLPLGEVGEVCIRGPQVMQGYWQRPDETAKVMFDNGLFRSGDLGVMNSDGFVKLVDRKKDMILVSGFNVYPNEIEEVICSHPKVSECAAIGVPDAKSGEVVKVFIVKKKEDLTVEEILAYCRENLTGYKMPKTVEFRTDLPKSNVGKILRKELRS